ncbi:hypothetical protein [uncultured Friedmanniella sp.]|uniref:hypothetical protein n=1 Tax=uncultured Friedmanniella sp. TaxID=335381 RepID=UPI0035CC621E
MGKHKSRGVMPGVLDSNGYPSYGPNRSGAKAVLKPLPGSLANVNLHQNSRCLPGPPPAPADVKLFFDLNVGCCPCGHQTTGPVLFAPSDVSPPIGFHRIGDGWAACNPVPGWEEQTSAATAVRKLSRQDVRDLLGQAVSESIRIEESRRDSHAAEVAWTQRHLDRDMERLDESERCLQYRKCYGTALMIEESDIREVALKLSSTWSGTPEELLAAAEAVSC